MRERSNVVARRDPLSDIVELAQMRSMFTGGFRAHGRWSLRFPPPERIKFFACIEGGCALDFPDRDRLRLEPGDVVVVSRPVSFVLSNDDATEPLDALAHFGRSDGTLKRVGKAGPENYFQIGGHVALDDESMELFRQLLPPLLHVKSPRREAKMVASLLEQISVELAHDEPGALAATAQLARLLFLQVLRVELAGADPGPLRAFGDPRLAPALRLMHADPARDWQLDELARATAMSRTSFATHFKSVAGVAPLAYLTGFRMRLAQNELRRRDATVAELAEAFGYRSESAFSTAFKRVTGASPQHYRASQRAAR